MGDVINKQNNLFHIKNTGIPYFRICPKCGLYMSPHICSRFGYVYTAWLCPCGYSLPEEPSSSVPSFHT